MKAEISIVVPCYNESEVLSAYMEEMERVAALLSEKQIEIIFVDDGSRDETLGAIRRLTSEKISIRYISFSRNFGKESAIFAGLQRARGEYVAVMDADLQDPPELLPEMLRLIQEEGYDCVGTRRISRQGEPMLRSLFARAFYKLINRISEIKLVDGARDYKLLTRKVADAILSLHEYNRFSKGLNEWVGFRTKWLEYKNRERVAGCTKWSFWSLCRYAMEGIIAFTTAPLAVASLLGIAFVGIATISMVAICLRQLVWHSSADGWTSMVCIILMLSGVQLLCIGILCQYLAKMYMEVKQRPHFVVAQESDSTHT